MKNTTLKSLRNNPVTKEINNKMYEFESMLHYLKFVEDSKEGVFQAEIKIGDELLTLLTCSKKQFEKLNKVASKLDIKSKL